MEKGAARHELFYDDELNKTLSFMEALRKRQREGDSIQFVTFSSENPDSVGNPGVDVIGPDYNWTKRRTTETRKQQREAKQNLPPV
jgi:hypothetical protein